MARRWALTEDNDQQQHPWSGPFGMGRQGYLIIVIIILVTAIFAASRSGDWTSTLVSAVVPPLIMFTLIFTLSRRWQTSARDHDRNRLPRADYNQIQRPWFGPNRFESGAEPQTWQGWLINFLVLTNVWWWLLAHRPQTWQGWLVALITLLAPFIVVLTITAITGQLSAHLGPQFP